MLTQEQIEKVLIPLFRSFILIKIVFSSKDLEKSSLNPFVQVFYSNIILRCLI